MAQWTISRFDWASERAAVAGGSLVVVVTDIAGFPNISTSARGAKGRSRHAPASLTNFSSNGYSSNGANLLIECDTPDAFRVFPRRKGSPFSFPRQFLIQRLDGHALFLIRRPRHSLFITIYSATINNHSDCRSFKLMLRLGLLYRWQLWPR